MDVKVICAVIAVMLAFIGSGFKVASELRMVEKDSAIYSDARASLAEKHVDEHIEVLDKKVEQNTLNLYALIIEVKEGRAEMSGELKLIRQDLKYIRQRH